MRCGILRCGVSRRGKVRCKAFPDLKFIQSQMPSTTKLHAVGQVLIANRAPRSDENDSEVMTSSLPIQRIGNNNVFEVNAGAVPASNRYRQTIRRSLSLWPPDQPYCQGTPAYFSAHLHTLPLHIFRNLLSQYWRFQRGGEQRCARCRHCTCTRQKHLALTLEANCHRVLLPFYFASAGCLGRNTALGNHSCIGAMCKLIAPEVLPHGYSPLPLQ